MNKESSANTFFKEMEVLFLQYKDSRIAYYRELFKMHDKLLLSQISKIPDEWSDHSAHSAITDESKRRLSDMKKYKSWELRLEIFFMYYLVDVENYLLNVLNYRPMEKHEFEDAIDSINSILVESGSNLIDFRYLLLSVAKRSISDLYYLMAAYMRFYNEKPFDFLTDFVPFINEASSQFERYRKVPDLIRLINDASTRINRYFLRSSNYSGWRLDEIALRQHEATLDEKSGIIADLSRILPGAFNLKNRMKKDFSFLGFYYNRDTGKMFRLNYVKETMQKKIESGSGSKEIFDRFEDMRRVFERIKQTYDMNSLENFGPEEMPYSRLVEFIFKGSKFLEYYYLRNGKYELLQNLRNDMLVYIEKEYHKIMNIKAR